DRNGYIGKRFEISEVAEDPLSGAVTIAIRERNPDDYDWRPEFELPTTLPSSEVEEAPLGPLPGFAVSGFTMRDRQGRPRRPALRIAWSSSIRGSRSITWRVRLQSTG